MAGNNACKVCLTSEPDAVILCDGVCGQYFHPSCGSRASRSSSGSVTTCLECSAIKPCHILRLVNNIFGEFSREHAALADKLTSITNNWASLQLLSEDLFNTSQKIAKLIDVTETVSSNTGSLLDKLLDLRSKIMFLTDSIEDFRNSIDSIESLSTSASASGRSSAVSAIDDIRSDMSLLKRDLASWFSASTKNTSQLNAAAPDLSHLREKSTYSSDSRPVPPANAVTEIPELLTSAPPTAVLTSSAPQHSTASVGVQTCTAETELAPTLPPVVHKLGTVWTEKDWNRRLQKLHGANAAPSMNSTPLLLKGAPRYADSAWIRSFFSNTFGITPINYEKIRPRKSRNPHHLVWIDSCYAWLFSNTGSGFNYRGISIAIWTSGANRSIPSITTNKSNPSVINRVKRSKTPNPRPSTSFTPKIPPPHPKTNNTKKISYNNVSHDPPSRPSVPSVSSNWQLKPSLFPNFNYSKTIKYPNFIKSHTINPAVPSQPSLTTPSASASHPRSVNEIFPMPPDTSKLLVSPAPPSPSTSNGPPPNSAISIPVPISLTDKPSFIDPLLPPIVKLTRQSADSCDSRYLLSRFRDHRIYDNVRLLLAYLHDKPNTVCIDGKTKTHVLTSIHQEGLPTDLNVLRNLFFKYHESLDIPSNKVSEDLTTYASYVSSRRVSHLQKSRNDFRNYYRS